MNSEGMFYFPKKEVSSLHHLSVHVSVDKAIEVVKLLKEAGKKIQELEAFIEQNITTKEEVE